MSDVGRWLPIKTPPANPEQTTWFAVIAVGRPIDLAVLRDGKFYAYEHHDLELDVLYWMAIPREPQELIEYFYGENAAVNQNPQPTPPWLEETQ